MIRTLLVNFMLPKPDIFYSMDRSAMEGGGPPVPNGKFGRESNYYMKSFDNSNRRIVQ